MNVTPDDGSLHSGNAKKYLGHRIVLRCRGELSFCGIARNILDINHRRGLLVETDSKSGFSVWCPLDYIKSVTIIPIPTGDSPPG
ncbi:MAG: hypothetical protein D6723_19760 [Acidobacteria bacterium]|nr:MAG: hypothetical protein D6723_19760 [Acidobacteriota bacterium]